MLAILKYVVGAVLMTCLVLFSIITSLVGVLLTPLRLFLSPRNFLIVYLNMADVLWKYFVFVSERWGHMDIKFYGDDIPDGESAYLISNHRWANDWLIFMSLAVRKGRVGCMKLFSKDWIKYIPGFGWGAWLIGFVFIRRQWTKDKSHIDATFARLKNLKLPFWLVSHTEGTRLTKAKLQLSQQFAKKRDLPHLDEVLLPRYKGFVATVQSLRNIKNFVLLDVTFLYVNANGEIDEVRGPGLMGIMAGKAENSVHIHVKRYTMNSLPKTDAGLQQWVLDRFVEKNKLIQDFRKSKKFPDPIAQPLQFPPMSI